MPPLVHATQSISCKLVSIGTPLSRFHQPTLFEDASSSSLCHEKGELRTIYCPSFIIPSGIYSIIHSKTIKKKVSTLVLELICNFYLRFDHLQIDLEQNMQIRMDNIYLFKILKSRL